uniref:Protein kinase domain-containing protein n=1 Tax=Scophthalmus maximus TaxID=52904 RepID=A0A8D3EEB7_SCOMX
MHLDLQTATDKAPPTEEESGTAATFTEDITNTNPLPAVCEPGDDRPPADIPTDEAAASISPYCSVLQSETTSYIMTGEIGLDYNRYFVKCVELTTGKEVAVKIPYYEEFIEETFQNELAMLEKIRALDPDRHNIVTFIEKCQYDELPCLVFEVMDISLLDLLKERERRALSVNEIRPVTQQLLVALEALKNIGIIHMDLNPDNIILVNHKDQPFKIKLSDFGLARPVSQVSRDDVTRTLCVLQSETTSYKITGFIGGGGCANVAKCVDLNTGKEVAIKIHNKKYDEEIIQNELAMLGKIRALDPDRHNIVKFIEKCQYGELPCLVFEMLDISLSDLIEERERRALSVNELRPVTQQLLVALEALKNFGIIHMDLNPDNIILVNHNDQPFQIKLIDFGLARPGSQVEDDDLNWTLWYRPPEGVLGVPLSEAVDMWGVGCVMAFMYFGRHLFPNMYPEDWMDTQVHLLGVPDQNQIIAGKNSWRYFFLDEKAEWRRRKDAVKTFQIKKDDLEYEDRMEFLDLLKCCLHVSAEQRICPREALCHRFITMAHLADEKETNSYTNKALEFMKVCSTRLSSISCLSEEVPLPDNAPRPSAATDTAPPTEEESGTAATFTENITNTNRLPAVCEPGDDRPPADIPTDEAAASISSNHRVLQSETTSYKITGFIGGGGCANVAKCVDLNTGKEVAIKIHNKKM